MIESGTCKTQGEILPIVRGAQAALFTRGLLLSVALRVAQDAARDRIHQILTDDENRASPAYREPWVGVPTAKKYLEKDWAPE